MDVCIPVPEARLMAATRKTLRKRRSPLKSADIAEKRHGSIPNAALLVDVARQLRSWTDSVLGVAGAAADITMDAAKMLLPKPGQRKMLEKGGVVLRKLRQAAGLSLGEVGAAIDLSDPSLLDLVENGKIVLPFEIILRLASVLGRNDPISFVMRFTRLYNPEIWRTLEKLGVGRLALQAGREREFVNLYRANDAARELSDEDFSAVLGFTKAAFEMAMAFRRGKAGPRKRRSEARSTRA
jgi:transcriptional regulator with XRE-family HTH domain